MSLDRDGDVSYLSLIQLGSAMSLSWCEAGARYILRA
jgi:hypothetical protein